MSTHIINTAGKAAQIATSLMQIDEWMQFPWQKAFFGKPASRHAISYFGMERRWESFRSTSQSLQLIFNSDIRI
jgi:hypothetical protein